MKKAFVALGLLLSACTTHVVTQTMEVQNQTPATGSAGETLQDGSSSGGGSFGNESSLTILRWAADDLSQEILNSSPEIYAKLPQGWTREKLAQIIRDVEPTPADLETYRVPEVKRDGQRLMFNYGMKKDGTPFITATKLFLEAYSSYEVNSRPKQKFYYTLQEIRLKLIHETAHLLGLGLTQDTDMPEARKFAQTLVEALDRDNFDCTQVSDIAVVDLYTAFELKNWERTNDGKIAEKHERREFIFNRPTGHAAEPYGGISICSMINQMAGVAENSPQSACKEDLSGGFSWSRLDPRHGVVTNDGFKSDDSGTVANRSDAGIDWLHDYQVKTSTAGEFMMEAYPWNQQEIWLYARSTGLSQIEVKKLWNGTLQGKIIILKTYSQWKELGDPEVPDIHIEVPLTCKRTYTVLPAIESFRKDK